MPPTPPPSDLALARRLAVAVSAERWASYDQHCAGDQAAALALYRWNGELSGAFWETLGHVEVLLRNTLSVQLAARQRRHRRVVSWIFDPATGLDQRGRDDIVKARRRVQTKGKTPTDGQIISELGFGFWRFLVARRYQATLWPDLASGFPHAPSRARRTVEDPIVRLHEFRNRVAHHERIWSEPVEDRYRDCLLLAGFIDRDLRAWIGATSRVPQLLERRP